MSYRQRLVLLIGAMRVRIEGQERAEYRPAPFLDRVCRALLRV